MSSYRIIHKNDVMTTALFFLIALSVPCAAQPREDAGPESDRIMQLVNACVEPLNLTAEQNEAVMTVVKEHGRVVREIMERYRGRGRAGLRAMRRDLREQRDQTDEKLEKLITEDQMKLFVDCRDEQRRKMREKMRQQIKNR